MRLERLAPLLPCIAVSLLPAAPASAAPPVCWAGAAEVTRADPARLDDPSTAGLVDDDGGFWVAGGVIHDTPLGTWLLTADSGWPTGYRATATDPRFYVGEDWREIADLEFDPADRPAPDEGVDFSAALLDLPER